MPTETEIRPPLDSGERLARQEFHRRYEPMPRNVKARLIGGVVYVGGDGDGLASPVSELHGVITERAGFWLAYFQLGTPGVRVTSDATLVLGPENEPQPDHMMYVAPDGGGGTRVVGGFVHGVPELAVEVAVSSRSIDLGPQRVDYERAGVPEYLVLDVPSGEVHWHRFQDGRLVVVPPDADGIYRSRSFPGLWFDPAAFWAGGRAGIIATLERGLASPEYAEFAARLRVRAPQPPGL